MSDETGSTKLAWMRGILDRYEGPLVRYAAGITGNVESARDVVQETFLRLCTEDRARIDSHVGQWLYTVCRNRALDCQRKEGRMKSLSETDVNAEKGGDHDPARIVERRETASRAHQTIAGLPENQQEVIRLRFQSGLSYKEIAGVMELSASNVGFLIHTAIRTVREKLSAPRQTEPRS